MLQIFLKRIIFSIFYILPIGILIFIFTQSSANYVVGTNDAQQNEIEKNVTTNDEQFEKILYEQAELKEITIQNLQISTSIPSIAFIDTTVSFNTKDQGIQTQDMQVLLDANTVEIETQLHRLELVLKGVDFSDMPEIIQEIDVRFKLPVLRTQKSQINT